MVEGLTIPIIDELVGGDIPFSEVILIEFDPDSSWFLTAVSMVAQMLKSGRSATFHSFSNPPDKVRGRLRRQGLDIERMETDGRFAIIDWYSASVGAQSNEKNAISSLQVSQMAIELVGIRQEVRKSPGFLKDIHLDDNWSVVFEQNDEKSVVQFLTTRVLVNLSFAKTVHVCGITRGLHSDYVYKTLENAAYGIVDVRAQELGGQVESLIRVRLMKEQNFDSRWHKLRVNENFEVSLAE